MLLLHLTLELCTCEIQPASVVFLSFKCNSCNPSFQSSILIMNLQKNIETFLGIVSMIRFLLLIVL